MQYEQVLEALKQEKLKDPRFTFSAMIAPSPDRDGDGRLDPRYALLTSTDKKGEQGSYFYKGIPVGLIRDAMGCENDDISKGLVEESILHIPMQNHIVDIILYRPFHTCENLPCMLYFHGGAYLGGSVKVTENICRALACAGGMAVINVDYRLAPEYAYPDGLDDCYECLEWAFQNAEKYRFDQHAIYVAGDSAGGNYAINCCLRDAVIGMNRIRGCCLYYPHVSMMETAAYPWSLDMYYISDANKAEIVKNMFGLREVIRLSEFYYLQNHAVKDAPEVSPLFSAYLDRMPKTLIISAEFDYLRIQQEYFAQKLYDADVEVQLIQYQGMQHAFMDHIGFYPQVEDAIRETCRFLNDKRIR